VATVRWVDGALRALFAPTCVACRCPIGGDRHGPVCAACWAAVRSVSAPWCDRCGEPLRTWRSVAGAVCARCQAHPPHYDQARAYGLYEGSLRHIVHALKYRGHQSLGAPLGILMREAGRDLLDHADVVIPVPLHPWRRLRRGFNQADTLACALGRPVQRPLVRRRLGPPQMTLGSERRRTNVSDAYGLSMAWTWTRRTCPHTVVLVDDVMTTGATLDACSRVLREAGVEWIAALTAARAVTTTAVSDEATRPPQPPRARRPSSLPR
jgi:ComF family protein